MTRVDAVGLVSALAAARKAAHLYPDTHPAYVETLAALTRSVSASVSAGPFTISLFAGRLYHENAALPSEVPAVRSLIETFESHRIESVTLHPDVSQHDLVSLLDALSMRPAPGFDLAAELERRGVFAITVGSITDEAAEESKERDRRREQDRALYHRLLALLRDLTQQVKRNGEPDLAQAGILVEGMLARLMEDSAAVLGMTTLSATSETELLHSINTMAYALVVGAEMQIPEDGLVSLGVSALLHDIGKAAFDLADPAQAQRAQLLHPVVGAQVLARIADSDRTPMLVAYEHHMGADGSGFPEREPEYVTHPYSRIVAIADRYDHLAAPEPHGLGLSRDRAMLTVLNEGGAALDGLFARLLAKAFGIFPVGCVVRLSDQSIAVVSAPGPSPLMPRIRVLFEPDGTEVVNPRVIDLAASGLEILEVVDPRCLAIDVFERL